MESLADLTLKNFVQKRVFISGNSCNSWPGIQKKGAG
jgi:hypothetical protein